MSAGQLMTVISSVLGAVGTALLFFFSYTDTPSGLSFWGGDDSAQILKEVNAKNKRWKRNQRIGFGLLTLSFLVQIVSVFFPIK
jgi:hypothetical protein